MTLLSAPIFRVSCRGILAIFILLGCYSSHYAQVAQPRPFVPDDITRLAEVTDTVLSTDGRWVAYVVIRPEGTYCRPYLANRDRADVWIAPVAGGQAQNLTNGAADDSGYWWPRWSPDGERLAMLSTKGGNVRLWLWTRSSGRLELLSERGVYSVKTDRRSPDPFTWISNQEVVIALLPPGEKPLTMESQTRRVAEITAREWAKAWEGKEPTASVLDSGAPVLLTTRPQAQMLTIDVSTRTMRVIDTGAGFGQAVLSPDKSHLAFLKQVDLWHPEPDKEVTRLYPSIFQVMVANLQGAVTTRTFNGAREALEATLAWSPDGTELAFVGNDKEPSASDASDPTVLRCRISDEACHAVTERRPDLDVFKQNRFAKPPMMWVGRNGLILFAQPKETSSPVDEQPKAWRWLGVDEKGHLYDFFGNTKGSYPSQIVREADRETLIGIIEGSIWRIGSDGRALQNLTPNFKEKITSIVWPDLQSPRASVKNTIVFGVRHDSTDNLYLLDLKSGEVKPLVKPSPEASLVAFDSENGTCVFRSDKAGTYVWAKPAGAKTFVPIVETNIFLREIRPGEARKIEYRSLDGQPLKGWVILPYGYQEGKRYPVVAWVYPNFVSDSPPRPYPSSQRGIFDFQLLPAHGYAVLLPSVPVKTLGEVEDPYLQLTKGVLPAVDKLVDLGIADPKRVGLIGWSYGGYSVYGLVTQTNRFQAAIAGSGFSDLISLYGTFSGFGGTSRYDANAHEDLFRMWVVEINVAMRGPAWKDFGRYLRNSPINYVDRVETPLMIIQGDLDPEIGIEQGEEFFTALYRQNKRARFVRYWGEGHGIDSPANIRDMWQRIYAWFDEFLMKTDDKKPSKE